MMSDSKRMTRRSFIKGSGAIAGGFTILPSSVI
ncbi:MAG: twin-arginine translocation signal domain-containing protein, partial [Chitinophagaceae bacterium]|nr:twin-arginine translocation signal domain-containing protein [Chitinophagaceae bacterium]